MTEYRETATEKRTREIREKRELEKDRYQAYQARAKATVAKGVSIPNDACVHMVTDGAYVEATVWVPLNELPERLR